MTREGIYFALLSGRWAAEGVLSGDPAAYAARVRAEILPELARAARLRAGFFRLASTGQVVRALRHSAAVSGVMADLIAGKQGYAGLKWRLLRTLEWRLAWQTLVTARNIRRGHAHGRPAGIR
jgi:flavin-dependent dehydrogenase